MRVIARVADQKSPGVDIEVKSLETWQADPTLRVVPPNTCPLAWLITRVKRYLFRNEKNPARYIKVHTINIWVVC